MLIVDFDSWWESVQGDGSMSASWEMRAKELCREAFEAGKQVGASKTS